MKLLRLAAICSSLALLFGCVWFIQKQANPTMMPSSKDIARLLNPGPNKPEAQMVIPGSKNGALIIPGSKSFTGGTTISAGVLQVGQTPPAKP